MDGWIPTTEALGGININNLKVTSSLMLFAVIEKASDKLLDFSNVFLTKGWMDSIAKTLGSNLYQYCEGT